MAGVAGLLQPHIKPGDTFAYEFTLRQHGTYMYHPHADGRSCSRRRCARGVVIRRGADSASPSASGLGPELHVQTGLSTASPHMSGATAGGSEILHQGRRLAFEGSGAYLNRGEGASALSLSAGVILNLLSTEEKAVPYIVGGGGVLRASFDTRSPRFSGAARSGEMGAGRYRHVMDGAPPDWDLGELPPFYGDRLQTLIARDGRTGRASFSDPALTLGAGVRVRLGGSLLAGQDARALLIMRSGSVYTLWIVTIHLGRAF